MTPSRTRIALVSDIHANLPALEAVLASIDREPDVAATYHVGDLVGYAPWPDEVVALLEQRAVVGVAGNYDSTVAFDYKHCGCRYEDPAQEALAHRSFEWTRARVSVGTKAVLARLPFRLDIRPFGGHQPGPTITLIHGNPILNTFYWTEDRDDAFCARMAAAVGARSGDVIGFGHTHVPWHRSVGGVHFINTGSVGKPKDGDPRAGYVLIELEAGGTPQVEFRRVDYDVDRALRAIGDAGLPEEFGRLLETGGRR